MTQPDNANTELVEALHSHVVHVQFMKSDGQVRLMRATLRASDLPTPTQSTTPRMQSAQVCRVWDLDKQAWRSFRTDHVQSWHVLDEVLDS